MLCDYLYKTKPFKHQEKIFLQSRDKEYFALLLEQGTGKTKITIDTACWLYGSGKIDAMLVIAPNGVNRNWVLNEIPIHAPEHYFVKSAWYSSSPTKQEEKDLCAVLNTESGLRIITINVEALATQKGSTFIKNFLLAFRTMLVVDESSVIKSPKAIRTKTLLKLSVHAKYRRILTGTPVTQGPLDLFTQFSFLDAHILRTQSYFAFRSRYAILKEMRTNGRSFQTVTGYCNLDELQGLIAPHSYRVTKADCLDLPEKLYIKRYVELSPTQRSLYNSLKKDIVAEFNGKVMSAPLALTKLLRLQQIVGGHFVPDIAVDFVMDEDGNLSPVNADAVKLPPEAIDKVNPRVESLIELLEETNGKVIIWARFRAEIAQIVQAIESKFGKGTCCEYHGGVSNEDRSQAIDAFQNGVLPEYFVGHVQAGGKGLTLHAATTVVYYSNNFSLEDRLQSEDRCHRIGQKSNVTYIDMIASNTLDEKIVKVLRDKHNVADLITGDESIDSWI